MQLDAQQYWVITQRLWGEGVYSQTMVLHMQDQRNKKKWLFVRGNAICENHDKGQNIPVFMKN